MSQFTFQRLLIVILMVLCILLQSGTQVLGFRSVMHAVHHYQSKHTNPPPLRMLAGSHSSLPERDTSPANSGQSISGSNDEDEDDNDEADGELELEMQHQTYDDLRGNSPIVSILVYVHEEVAIFPFIIIVFLFS